MCTSPAWQPAARSLLFSTITSHDAVLAAIVLISVLLIAAVLAIALVSLTDQKDRVAAIHAAAEVLKALLPWPTRHHRPSKGEKLPPGPSGQSDH